MQYRILVKNDKYYPQKRKSFLGIPVSTWKFFNRFQPNYTGFAPHEVTRFSTIKEAQDYFKGLRVKNYTLTESK